MTVVDVRQEFGLADFIDAEKNSHVVKFQYFLDRLYERPLKEVERVDAFLIAFYTSTEDGTLEKRITAFLGEEDRTTGSKTLPIEEHVADVQRPLLTYETYCRLKERRHSDNFILQRYRLENNRVFGGFKSSYKRFVKKGKKKLHERKEAGLPKHKLTYQEYCVMRNQGKTYDKIKELFPSAPLPSYSGNYNRYVLKHTSETSSPTEEHHPSS